MIVWSYVRWPTGKQTYVHMCACVREHTHTGPFFCFASVANAWTGCICSHKNNAKGKNTSAIIKEQCCVPQRALGGLFLCFVFPIIINLIWDGECGINKYCFCVTQDLESWGQGNSDKNKGTRGDCAPWIRTLHWDWQWPRVSHWGGRQEAARHSHASHLDVTGGWWPLRGLSSVRDLRTPSWQTFFSSFSSRLSFHSVFLQIYFSLCSRIIVLNAGIFLYFFYLFFRASCFHFVDVIIFPLSKFMN